jgi:hypothetical protein
MCGDLLDAPLSEVKLTGVRIKDDLWRLIPVVPINLAQEWEIMLGSSPPAEAVMPVESGLKHPRSLRSEWGEIVFPSVVAEHEKVEQIE